MRLSDLLGKTVRELPAEAELVSHQLLLKAGMIYQSAAGVYSYLPLAWRALKKIENIIREEMDATGGQEMMMPVLQPIEVWRETGRDALMKEIMFTLTDRRGRTLALGPTHEELTTDIIRHFVRSYRDMPLKVYQFQTKFRDEPRARGGLIRVREFIMKDLYSFDVDDKAATASYYALKQAYSNVYRRCGLSAVAVEADSGAIGGKLNHEFMVLAASGENEIVYCSRCDYAANEEAAESVKIALEAEEPRALEEVATPGIKTIANLSAFLDIPPYRTLKAVFYMADTRLVFVVIRGDYDVNEIKLKNALKAVELRLARDEEVEAAGLVPGFASPVGLQGVYTVVDTSVTTGANYVAGANRPDYHLRNVNYPRDFAADLFTDIANTRAGDPCPRCQSELLMTRGIEVGHVFKLGTIYSTAMNATFLDKDGQQRPIVMGSYGIGLGRLLAAAIEQSHDERGIIWPAPIAPYLVHLISLGVDRPEVVDAAERLFEDLQTRGIEVLYDDRDESAGVKFNDADLLGMPLRVTISQRTLRANSVELKARTSAQSQMVPWDDAIAHIKSLLDQMLNAVKV
ncbi:MAG: proline--tRNA ligase [Chloroflexota bacterium]|nr:MAG: proline--tRNA ligase [Chloroflexota bacterium]